MIYSIDTQTAGYNSLFTCGLGDTIQAKFKVTRNNQDLTFTNPIIKFNVKKADGNFINQDTNITYVDGVINIDFWEQCVTFPGITACELLIVENGRTTTSRFFFYVRKTLDNDIVNSFSEVKTLDELEKYLAKAYQDLNEYTQKIEYIEKENLKLNTTLNANEEVRKSQETSRVNTEAIRVEAENNRKIAETNRVDVENARVGAEEQRVVSENSRVSAENNREVAESKRQQDYEVAERDRYTSYTQAEATRNNAYETAEADRRGNEDVRISNEVSRRNAEDTRVSNENSRKSAETSRAGAEATRVNQENTRKSQETSRVNAESGRTTAETSRVEAEELRVQAEQGREARLQAVETKSTNNATSIADITKYEEGSNIDQNGKVHDTLNQRLNEDYVIAMDKINNANYLPYESEFISASNSYKGMTKDNVIKGRTLQNVINNTAWIISSETIRHMKVNWNLLKPNTKYTCVLCNPSNKIDLTRFKIGKNFTVPDHNATFPFLVETRDILGGEGTLEPHIYAKVGEVFLDSDLISTKLILLEGDYTNQPIPAYFEGIKSVNEDGENLEEVSCGKNLFDPEYMKQVEGTTYEIVIKDGRECIKPLIHNNWLKKPLGVEGFKQNTQYSVSYDVYYEHQTTLGLYLYVVYTDGTEQSLSGNKLNLWHRVSYTTSPNKTIKNLTFSYATSSSITYIDLNSLRINEGTALVDEPYQEHRLPIKMKNLRGLPNGVSDTSDGVRRIIKRTLTGTEGWYEYGSATDTNFFSIACETYNDVKNVGQLCICDKFVALDSYSTLYYRTSSGIYCGYTNISKGRIVIGFEKSIVNTVSQAKTWLQANPTTVYYELETPTTEEGNTEELRTYDGTTHIFTEGSLIAPKISCKVPSNVQQVVMDLNEENTRLRSNVDTLEKDNMILTETNENQDVAIDVTMVATMELYDMIAPTEPMTRNISGGDKMVDFYVVAVQRGLRTIDQVPLKYRDEVTRILAELEK